MTVKLFVRLRNGTSNPDTMRSRWHTSFVKGAAPSVADIQALFESPGDVKPLLQDFRGEGRLPGWACPAPEIRALGL